MKIKWLRNLLKNEIVEKVIGNVAYRYLKFVGDHTDWVSVEGVERTYQTIHDCGSVIIIGWHGRTLLMPYFWNKSSKLNALVSPHQDGRIIVNILEKFGIGHISGSSNQKSVEAGIQLMKNLHNDNSIAIIPDGPRGPRMKLSMSPLFYAQKSGKPILGITYSTEKAKIITKSWDNMLVPLPYKKGMYAITEPIFIPQNATPEELEQYRLKIETTLNELTWKLDKKMGLPFIPQGTKIKKEFKKNIKKEES